MRHFLLGALLVVVGCGTPSNSGNDAGLGGGSGGGAGEDGGTSDAGADAGFDGGVDAGFTVQTETEPNNAATATEVNAVVVPGEISGAINPARDLDVLYTNLTAGEFWQWTMDPGSGALFPHLAVTDNSNTVPNLVAKSDAASAVTQEQFVLKTGRYNVILRDSRNVASTGAQAGSATHTWKVTATKQNRSPTAIPTLPATIPATLGSLYSVHVYSFTLSTSTSVTIDVVAASKSSPSQMDPRLSLYDQTRSTYVQTNDDISTSNVDSRLTGTLNPGTYLLVIDNVAASGTDMSYELRVTTN